MRKHFISFLIGLLSLAGIYTGVTSHQNQNSTLSVEIEENVETDDGQLLDSEDELEKETVDENKKTTETSVNNAEKGTIAIGESNSEVATENNNENIDETKATETKAKEIKPTPTQVKKQVTETKAKETIPKTIDKVINANSNDQIKNLYNELSNCDNNTIYKKVVINGQEYNNKNAQVILNDLVSTYGQDLSKLDIPEQTQAPTETQAPTQAETQPPQTTNGNYASQVLQLVNQERANAGLSALTTNGTLTSAANQRATEIVSTFSHTRPNGSAFHTVLEEHGVSMQTAGENIAYGQRTPSEVVNAWMNSSGHRANILNAKFGKMGVGVYEVNGTIYWTQLFTN